MNLISLNLCTMYLTFKTSKNSKLKIGKYTPLFTFSKIIVWENGSYILISAFRTNYSLLVFNEDDGKTSIMAHVGYLSDG